jgi:hypothetical protein
MHGNNDTGEWHEDEEFARGPFGEDLGQTEF